MTNVKYFGFVEQSTPQEQSDPELNLLQMLALPICMAGVQFTCYWFVVLKEKVLDPKGHALVP
ncbi:hypothetical protein BCR42DRAFT_433266 [Absidia repens]|uniref:Uncharacterized protein n=1 Tax=Absidia repens TaxID=90262 RepID=A0A1X2IX38_9FUNG|nr:hypothetical protein BCR42DRAFT_433266 [Absidia repens]